MKTIPDLVGDRDQRPQRFTWAPGGYLVKCSQCGERFVGDKRARLCAPCAYNDAGLAKERARLWWCIHHAESLASITHRFSSLPLYPSEKFVKAVTETIDIAIHESQGEPFLRDHP